MSEPSRLVPLRDLLLESSEVLGTADEPIVLTLTEGKGFVSQIERFNKRLARADTSDYKVVRKGDIAYNPYLLWTNAIAMNREWDKAIVSPAYPVFRLTDQVDPSYVLHILGSPVSRAYFDKISVGSVPRRRRAPVDDFLKLRIPLPPLPEQRRIASILDEAQRVLELSERSLLAADMLESALLVHLMAKAEKSERSVRLDSIAETLTGPFGSALHRADYAPGGVPIVNPMHIVAGQIKTSDDFAVGAEKASELTAYRLRVNDVVLGRRGELGRAAAVREEHLPALCGTGSMIVRPRLSNLPAAYLAGVLASPSIKRRLESQAQGATMLNLNQTIVGALPISVPSGEDLEEFEVRLAELRKLKHSHSQRLRVQQELAATLQARAFRGEL